MSNVGLLILCHKSIGAAMVDTTVNLLGPPKLPFQLISIGAKTDLTLLHEEACRAIKQLDRGDGVLVVTDLFGATPGNIAMRLSEVAKIRIVCGMNLPMVLRIFNYQQEPLETLAEKAIQGGTEGIILYDPKCVKKKQK